MWKIDTKDKHMHKKSMITYKLICKKMFIIVELLYGTWGKRE
jgi:hypothetical protein